MKKIFFILLGLWIILVFSACSAKQSTYALDNSHAHISKKIDKVFSDLPSNNEISNSIKTGVSLMKKGEFESASDQFRAGLRLDPTNGHLHFLNALTYHMSSLSGDSKMLKLAEAGYLTTLRFDRTNFWAAYLVGHIYFEQQRFLDAQNQFSYGLLYAPQNPYLLRGLATASYYCNDISLSQWAAKKAFQIDPNNSSTLRTLMFSKAAAGDVADARKLLENFKSTTNKEDESNNYIKQLTYNTLSNRMNDWGVFYASADAEKSDVFNNSSNFKKTFLDTADSSDNYQPEDSVNTPTPQIAKTKTVDKKAPLKLPKMTLVDVVILRTEEVRSQAKGINLLDGLKATLGGTLYSYTLIDGSGIDNTRFVSMSPTLDLMGLEYNLNIFNDNMNKAEVLARPSLLAVENKPSKFYSGSVLHVQLSSNNADGSMIDVPIGIHLNITPKFHTNDVVEITVHAERSFLETLSSKVGFTTFSQTSKTSVDATAVLKFGETLILSGLSESESDSSKSGVPILQDIPGVQYLFSRAEDLQTKKSILILITPRKARNANQGLTPQEIQDALKAEKEEQTIYTSDLKQKENIIKSNINVIYAHLYNNQFYQQFRTGDLQLDEWNNEDTFGGSLKRILGFLYY